MFKIDQVKNLFDCEQCYQLLVDPIALPCGTSVCKTHLDELLEYSPKESNTFLCKLCDDEHSVPKKGFVIHKRIQNALNIKFNTLKLNPVYEECKKEINDVKMKMQKIEALEKDPEYFIFEYFEKLKRQVDLRRETLKLKLDNCSDEIMQSIENTKENCIKMSKETKRLNSEIEKSKEELNKLIDIFDTFEISDKKFEDIKKSLIVLNSGLTRKLGVYKDSIIGDHFTFKFDKIRYENLFGCFKKNEKVIYYFICH